MEEIYYAGKPLKCHFEGVRFYTYQRELRGFLCLSRQIQDTSQKSITRFYLQNALIQSNAQIHGLSVIITANILCVVFKLFISIKIWVIS